MEQLVTTEGGAKHFQVSIATVRAWVRKGDIPEDTYAHFGNTYRFKLSAVVDSLLNKKSEDDESGDVETLVDDLFWDVSEDA